MCLREHNLLFLDQKMIKNWNFTLRNPFHEKNRLTDK